MCCFTGPVKEVGNTRIFARALDGGWQALIYSMSVDAPQDVAMVLPLPVKPGTGDNGIVFLDLQAYPALFQDLSAGFPTRGVASGGGDPFAARAAAAPALKVENIGAFEASFVPRIQDFTRLDARFQLPAGTWEKLPAYADYGFAVFKLKAGRRRVHPMAFRFPSRHPDRLFFPTVHIHDGEVHAKEKFDHTFYLQTRQSGLRDLMTWEESPSIAAVFTKAGETHGLIDPALHVRRVKVNGEKDNRDLILSFA